MRCPLLYMVRHGQTSWNVEGRLQGQADIALSKQGFVQAARNGRKLAALINDPDLFDFVASLLSRARATMERLRIELGLPSDEYQIDERLLEINFGDWQGYTYAELEALHPGLTLKRRERKWSFLPPGQFAESYEFLARRVQRWLDEQQRPTVCVTHGGVIRSVLYLVEGFRPEVAAETAVPQDRILRITTGKWMWL